MSIFYNYSFKPFNIQDQINHPDTIIIYKTYDEELERYYLSCYNKLKEIDISLYNLFLLGMLMSCIICHYRNKSKNSQIIYVEEDNSPKSIIPAKII